MIASTFGIKGKGAAAWLKAQGIALPVESNTRTMSNSTLALRLGRSEYLIDGASAARLRAAWQAQPASDAYLVPRYDAAFELDTASASKVLPEICTLDTRAEAMRDRVLMTLGAGISITLIHDGQGYRLWCDATYGDYLQQVLQEITA